MSSLKEAINAESATDAEQKERQLGILKEGAENLDDSQLDQVVHGNFGSLAKEGYSQDAIDSLKELAVYRIQNHLSIHPFSEYQAPVGPCLY